MDAPSAPETGLKKVFVRTFGCQMNVYDTGKMRALLEQAPGFVAVLAGSDHRFVMANAAYRRLTGERELEGRRVGEALPEIVEQEIDVCFEFVRKIR